jgi:hypothetical protein
MKITLSSIRVFFNRLVDCKMTKPDYFQRPRFWPKWKEKIPPEEKEDDELKTIKQCIKTRGIVGGSKVA